MAKAKTVKKSASAKKIVKKASKQSKPKAVTKSPAINKFLFGHDEVTRNDIIEVLVFVGLAAFLLFVHLKVNEII